MKLITSVSFNKKLPLIIVPVTIKRGNKIWDLKFAVDTGATVSLVDIDAMSKIGYQKNESIRTTQTLTASKIETVYEFKIDSIKAIELLRNNFNVFARSLPIGLGIDGLLGLNFFKNKELTIDFKSSEIRIK